LVHQRQQQMLDSLKAKMHIGVQHSRVFYMLPDLTGCLRPNEVYCYDSQSGNTILGDVCVCRNPVPPPVRHRLLPGCGRGAGAVRPGRDPVFDTGERGWTPLIATCGTSVWGRLRRRQGVHLLGPTVGTACESERPPMGISPILLPWVFRFEQ
jgi:hypothetical protein